MKHLRVQKEMSFNQQFQTKWREAWRKRIGYYEKVISLKKLFKEAK
ncbi:MAG: hypothetical protein ACTSQJ_06050 [Promethearchaeota archaeon]